MGGNVPQLRQGDIVLAQLPDPEGRSIVWPHPAIILNKTNDILPENKIVVLGITTKFAAPLETGQFRLPWSPDGDKRTGLRAECVVKCSWRVAIDYKDIQRRIGFTPPDVWDQIKAEILYQIKKKRSQREPP